MKQSALFLLISFLAFSCGGDDSISGSNPGNITFTSEAPSQIHHSQLFQFQSIATHKSGDPVTISIQAPGWLDYDEPNNRVSGIPDWKRLNSAFRINVMATNGIDTAIQRNDIQVVLGEIRCESDFGAPEDSKFILPYNVGESYRMWQSYCHPQWSHKNWFSYDFDMPMGTEILASRAGKVIFERDNFADGTRVSGEENFVFIQHNDGTVTHYVHIMKGGSKVEVGQLVAQGELIALSGDSGGSAGPHLHTSLFIGRTSFDRQYSIPMNYSNAKGKLNGKRGLVIDEYYEAEDY